MKSSRVRRILDSAGRAGARRVLATTGLQPRWMRALLDLPFVGVAIFDAWQGRWVQFNDRFCATAGRNRAELARLPLREIVHPQDRAGCDAAFKRLTARRSRHARTVQRLVRKDGAVVRAEIDFSFARSGPGADRYVVALVADVAERRAPPGDAHYQKIFSEGQTAVVVLDADSWEIVDANPAAQRFYGWTLPEIRRLGLHVWDVSLADREAVQQRLREAADGVISRVEGTHRTASGETRNVEIYCGPVSVAGRRCLYGIVHDVTERNRADAARRDAEEKLRAIVEQSLTGIYIIEDGRFSYVNPRMAEIFGYAPDEMLGLPAPEVAAAEDRDRVVENIRRRVVGETASVQYEFRGRRKDGGAIEVGVHGSVALIRGRRVIVGVVQDITERRKAKRHIDEYLRKLEASVLGTVNSISRMVDLRDPYTAGHERRVGHLAAAMGRELGLENERVRGLEIAGSLHDIGKIGAPSEILSKPSRLSAPEFAIVKEHAVNGSDILQVIDFPWPVAEVAHQHHERMDGSGYPRGLKGDEILHESRILAVADVIEAMSSHRPYRASLGIEPALAEIESGAGSRYDADCAASALRLFRDGDYRIPT